jgi:hypothetical protein
VDVLQALRRSMSVQLVQHMCCDLGIPRPPAERST